MHCSRRMSTQRVVCLSIPFFICHFKSEAMYYAKSLKSTKTLVQHSECNIDKNKLVLIQQLEGSGSATLPKIYIFIKNECFVHTRYKLPCIQHKSLQLYQKYKILLKMNVLYRTTYKLPCIQYNLCTLVLCLICMSFFTFLHTLNLDSYHTNQQMNISKKKITCVKTH